MPAIANCSGAMPFFARARDNAWTQAQILDAIGANAIPRKQVLVALGRNVGFAGRALLTPLG
jgi:hypothetical protein